MHETTILKHLNHNNVVKFYESFESNNHILIIMEYISCGDLLTFVRKRSKLSENVARYIFKQIIEALNYIHSNNIIHRDIKLDNILIDLNNTIKICDFGVSKKFNNNETIFDQCGTPAYIAPEILKNEGFQGPSADIWSAGIVLYAIVQGKVPFYNKDVQQLYQMIINNNYHPLQKCSNELENLMKCLLEKDPKKRITGSQILNHPWLKIKKYNQNLNNQKVNFFTAAEKVMFTKNNIDYRNCNLKEQDLEEFSIHNMDTINLKAEEHVKTKSMILAPFNTDIEGDFTKIDNIYICNNIDINNNIVKYKGKAKELNKNYELNNNCEIDNGMIISPNGNTFNSLNNNSISDTAILQYSNNKVKSKLSAKNLNKKINAISSIRASGIASPILDNNNNNSNINNKYNNLTKDEDYPLYDEKIVQNVADIGYSKNFTIKSILTDNLNYATACYYLMKKDD